MEVARVAWQVWLGVFAKRCGMFWAACELCGAAVAFARKRRFYICVLKEPIGFAHPLLVGSLALPAANLAYSTRLFDWMFKRWVGVV